MKLADVLIQLLIAALFAGAGILAGYGWGQGSCPEPELAAAVACPDPPEASAAPTCPPAAAATIDTLSSAEAAAWRERLVETLAGLATRVDSALSEDPARRD